MRSGYIHMDNQEKVKGKKKKNKKHRKEKNK